MTPLPESSVVPPTETGVGTALVCIDMQAPLLRAIGGAEQIVRRCEFAVGCATGLRIPVIFTEQVPEKLGTLLPELRAAAPHAPVHAKRCFSALGEPRLQHAILGDSTIEHLLLCGVETPVCVYQTAIAALRQGLDVTVLSDAVGGRRTEDANVCLEALMRAGAHVLPSETVFYALLQDADHPYFKAYTQRVKAAS